LLKVLQAASRWNIKTLTCAWVALLCLSQASARADEVKGTNVRSTLAQDGAPDLRLPGSGLAQHDFLYAGESKERRVFIVRKGRIVWTYEDPAGRGEISDATLLSNRNILIAHQYAVKLISPEKKVLWNLDAPKGTEIHTAMPIGDDHVVYVQNGDPAFEPDRAVPRVEGEAQFYFSSLPPWGKP
jgi:hypothetical protein